MRPKRTRLERGIYGDLYGISAIVTVKGKQQEKRFPLDTDREEIRRWRRLAVVVLDAELQGVGHTVSRHTLEKDVRTYLERRKGRPGFAADRSHLRAWIARYSSRKRRSVTRQDVEVTLAEWRSAGISEKTIRHRCRVLRELYQTLDGPEVKHPLQGLRLPTPRRPAPTAVPRATIQKVAKALKVHPQDYARFLVRATTGQRPAQIMKAVPTDVDLVKRIWFVRPSKGGDQIPLPLNDGMVAAWKAFRKAKAWGAFDTSQHAKRLRDVGWPDGVRPYDLRHTFAIDLLKSGADLGDVQGLLGHADIQTTRQFYAPILISRLTAAVKKRKLSL